MVPKTKFNCNTRAHYVRKYCCYFNFCLHLLQRHNVEEISIHDITHYITCQILHISHFKRSKKKRSYIICLYVSCLGLLCDLVSWASPQPGVDTPAEALAKLLVFHLNSKSAIQRLVVAHVITEWTLQQQQVMLEACC